jgi:hypothetical protein
MINKVIIISFIAILLTLLSNIEVIRCQENFNMITNRYQSNYMERINEAIIECNLKDDKNTRVEILGLIIQHNLFSEYQKIDSSELEDKLARGR